ncbi:MAG: metallophosphoesterase [bacterium]
MFGTILISIVTVMHIYVFLRAASVPVVKSHVPKKIIFLAGLFFWLVFYLGRTFGHGGTGTLAVALELIGMNWMAGLFLIFICLLAVDLVTVFGSILSRLAPRLRGLAILTGVVLSIIGLIQGLRPPVIENYDVYLSGLPIEMENTVIIAMSDLHLGSLLGESWLKARVAQVLEQKPDLVVLLGDIFEGHGDSRENLFPIMKQLSALLEVWAVYGNHEFYHHNDNTASLFEKSGIPVLRNRWTELKTGLILAGVDDLRTSSRRSGEYNDLISKALADRPPGTTILLSHTPWGADRAAKAGVGLMLCGHTHGGQIWPFDYFVRREYPLLEGMYDVNGMAVIVCRGTGTWGPRMRLWSPGEISRVTLHRKKPVGITSITEHVMALKWTSF